jgi:hypothetical protein
LTLFIHERTVADVQGLASEGETEMNGRVLKQRLGYIENPLSPTQAEQSDMRLFEAMVKGVSNLKVRAYLQTKYLWVLRARLEDKLADDPTIRKNFDDLIAFRFKEIVRMALNAEELEAVGIL